ncbi:VOC family protein [Pseudofrankia inefficax]|uniref:Glyoxalase/bleomycin resistance protein/dioxygenase n=1 Tax=Pseudofrankia inefficax (strain DSM 45817 / CECT 9037 / DDB 130130 / EuI1c) TaxID=298654 RepID=E3J6K5_PSEI1|nr:VOC family protein [Pseudofrankia inefficax]ADP80781.1 Glyoxalase/bleomycin resistance protein/dioxygenase [Pseudofrankia inefficax]
MTSDLEVTSLGVSTGDLEMSVLFYTEGLGFERVGAAEFGDVFAALCEVEPPMRARSQIVAKGAVRLQFLEWTKPGPSPRAPLPRNVVGLTHLSCAVRDLGTIVARLVALGGTVLEDTRTRIPLGRGTVEIVCVADPNGVRIELAEYPERP